MLYKCFVGNGNVVCPNSSHNPENPNYKKELAKDRKAYKHIPKSQDGRGRPKQFSKEQNKKREKDASKKSYAKRKKEGKVKVNKKSSPQPKAEIKKGKFVVSFD
tara:strand:- start:6097 stop:6408 length:312 start_codon:yes stop_codon:yes gene_type:complete